MSEDIIIIITSLFLSSLLESRPYKKKNKREQAMTNLHSLRSSMVPRQCAHRTFAAVKQHWSVMRWVTKNLLSRVPLCFVNTYLSALGTHGGLGPLSLCPIYKQGLCLSSENIKRLVIHEYEIIKNIFIIIVYHSR
jgi:hypothetical protein